MLTRWQMFLTAPETKGKTLEEMDEVFDRGIPAWKKVPMGSRLDQIQRDIEKGDIQVTTTEKVPGAQAAA